MAVAVVVVVVVVATAAVECYAGDEDEIDNATHDMSGRDVQKISMDLYESL